MRLVPCCSGLHLIIRQKWKYMLAKHSACTTKPHLIAAEWTAQSNEVMPYTLNCWSNVIFQHRTSLYDFETQNQISLCVLKSLERCLGRSPTFKVLVLCTNWCKDLWDAFCVKQFQNKIVLRWYWCLKEADTTSVVFKGAYCEANNVQTEFCY